MTIVQILDKDFHTSILQHVKSITENRKPEKPKFRRLETIISNCPSTLTLKFDFASKFGPKSIPKKKFVSHLVPLPKIFFVKFFSTIISIENLEKVIRISAGLLRAALVNGHEHQNSE
jgi:hypothetical protein